jgi:TPR repeat protein
LRAAEADDSDSMNNLGVLFDKEGDSKQAKEWWLRCKTNGCEHH